MVLIIEDDENINSLLCNILKRSGYEVESALNGWDGYELAKNAVNNRSELLRLGADDFICKPFDIDEVLLRIDAVLRRTEGTKNVLTFKDMRVEKNSKRVFVCDKEITCTAMEYAILETMLSHPNKIFFRREICLRALPVMNM